ncbi:MAG TPA: SBBP repeat-containing protein [Verrucomicrobiae bacterium]|nr:SBBP repeat-containing protein [Verrucomicrobiae bacterium]
MDTRDRAGAIPSCGEGKQSLWLAIFVLVILLLSTWDARSAAPGQVHDSFGRLPLMFERKESGKDEFFCRGPGYTLFLSSTEAMFVFRGHPAEELRTVGRGLRTPSLESARTSGASHGEDAAVLRVKLAGARTPVSSAELQELPTTVNYFLGNNPAQWRRGVPTYRSVRYREVYPGVDLVYYGNRRQIEFDFVVGPGADPGRIELNFEGAEKIEIDAGGDLVLHTAVGPVRQQRPIVYQEAGGGRREVESRYVFRQDARASASNGRRIGIDIGAYNRNEPLVIDPVLIYSTYLGGVGVDKAWDIAVDANGGAYVVGQTASTNFPVTNASATNFNGGPNDVFVAKLDPQGTNLVFATYLGGNQQDVGFALALGGNGDIYLTGTTSSTNFPVTTNAVSTTNHGPVFVGFYRYDAFLARLDAAGTNLLYSTYLGGSFDDNGLAIAVDGGGSAYVTGFTASTDFPTNGFASAFGNGPGGNPFDAFIARLSTADATLSYSGYLGGSGDDRGQTIAVDAQGRAVVGGFTSSTDFAWTNALQTNYLGGAYDGFVTRFSPDGSAKLFSTYLGGNDNDNVLRVAVGGEASIYLTGFTSSTNFPTFNGASATNHGSRDVFVTKLDPNGTNIAYSTYVGGGGDEEGWGIAVDPTGSAYVVGETFSTSFLTANASQATNAGVADAFILKLATNGAAVEFLTLLGGSAIDYGFAVALDGDGNAYVAGQTGSTNFPTVPSTNGLQNAFGGGADDGFVVKIFPANIALRAERGGANDVTVLWPAGLVNYALQSNAALTATNNWTAVTNDPIVAGSDNSVTFTNSAEERFFRLKRIP